MGRPEKSPKAFISGNGKSLGRFYLKKASHKCLLRMVGKTGYSILWARLNDLIESDLSTRPLGNFLPESGWCIQKVVSMNLSET
jgi:hypothetical protein